MAVNLSIKDAPDEVVERLRAPRGAAPSVTADGPEVLRVLVVDDTADRAVADPADGHLKLGLCWEFPEPLTLPTRTPP